MRNALALSLLVLAPLLNAAQAQEMPFASHRAAYSLTLAADAPGAGDAGQVPTSASGLIAYEFRGSSCEGYVSNFRQVTLLQRSEGDPIKTDSRSMTFEDGKGRTMRFQMDGATGDNKDPPISGAAERDAKGVVSVDLTRPKTEKAEIGDDLLFPTQHLMHIIGAAKAGQTSLHAKVFDGSDDGKKTFETLSVIGKENEKPGPEVAKSAELAKIRHWPVTVSYFDAAKKDVAPEYTLSFELFENGISGNLKLDYGAFALRGELTSLELFPSKPCPK